MQTRRYFTKTTSIKTLAFCTYYLQVCNMACKRYKQNKPKYFVEVSAGKIDYKSIFIKIKQVEVEYRYIKQNVFKNISKSFNYVKNNLLP